MSIYLFADDTKMSRIPDSLKVGIRIPNGLDKSEKCIWNIKDKIKKHKCKVPGLGKTSNGKDAK